VFYQITHPPVNFFFSTSESFFLCAFRQSRRSELIPYTLSLSQQLLLYFFSFYLTVYIYDENNPQTALSKF